MNKKMFAFNHIDVFCLTHIWNTFTNECFQTFNTFLDFKLYSFNDQHFMCVLFPLPSCLDCKNE